MSAPTSRATRRRTIALWCSIIGLALIAVPLLMLLIVALTANSDNALAGVVPLFLLMFTSWIPLALGIIGLVLTRGAERPLLPRILAIATIVLVPVGFILSFVLVIV